MHSVVAVPIQPTFCIVYRLSTSKPGVDTLASRKRAYERRTETPVCTENPVHIGPLRESLHTVAVVIALMLLALNLLTALFKSKIRLEAENAALRRQLVVLRRKVNGRIQLSNADRLFFVQLYRWFPSILKLITVARPETLVRCIVKGFAATGAGSHARAELGHRWAQSCGR